MLVSCIPVAYQLLSKAWRHMQYVCNTYDMKTYVTRMLKYATAKRANTYGDM